MKSILLSTLFALALFASTAVLAATPSLPVGMIAVPLAAITNDRDTSVSRIELMLDDQAIVRGIYIETRASAQADPGQSKGQVYWLDSIESRKGVVLGQGQGVKAILLRGQIGTGNGSLVIKYLTNGIFRHYDECQVNLQRLGPGQWRLVNAYDGHPVKHIRVKTWALGISTLVNVCPVDAA
ncbi:hypothetical protein [Dyella sp.]|uniref:hypothetical protein n=1 Tax=Dyella sp. TaxID=1869338 RepID=UPI002D7693B0|nr:hypothetical protein [Dyella sp.]HET7332730.1 hypothetical protein [Dyella sp.]